MYNYSSRIIATVVERSGTQVAYHSLGARVVGDESQIFVRFPSCIAFSVKRILRFLYWLLNLHGKVQVTNRKAIMLDDVIV